MDVSENRLHLDIERTNGTRPGDGPQVVVSIRDGALIGGSEDRPLLQPSVLNL